MLGGHRVLRETVTSELQLAELVRAGLPAQALDHIAADDTADVPAMKGWRRELFGEKALALKGIKPAIGTPEDAVAAIERLADAGVTQVSLGGPLGPDPAEAVRLVAQESPDVVLMDIGLPGRSGIEATRAIRERDSGQHVVIYTGSDEYDDIGRAAEAGAAGYLHKSALMSPDLAEALQVLHRNYVSAPADE